MSKRKKISIAAGIALVAALAAVFCGVYFGIYFVPDREERESEFFSVLETCDFYENDAGSARSQTEIYPVMRDHLFSGGSGKTPKLLFIGYDGYLATGFKLRQGEANGGAFYIGEQGSMLLTVTGGRETGSQKTKTAPGWATIFTGQWNDVHKVNTNNSTLSKDVKSLILQAGEAGLKTSFSVSWKKHLTVTYKHEVKKARADGLPVAYNLGKDDADTERNMLASIENGDDAVFGILEYTDHAGHGSSYSLTDEEYVKALRDADEAAYRLIKKVESRPTYAEEDWLIVITSDHGGVLDRHGVFTAMEYFSFLITNKKL